MTLPEDVDVVRGGRGGRAWAVAQAEGSGVPVELAWEDWVLEEEELLGDGSGKGSPAANGASRGPKDAKRDRKISSAPPKGRNRRSDEQVVEVSDARQGQKSERLALSVEQTCQIAEIIGPRTLRPEREQ
jgi:hypothetical protein